MTLRTQAWGHDALTFDGQDMRHVIEAFSSPGVVGASDFLVTEQDTPDDTVKVAAGLCVVEADGAGLYGRYLVPNVGDATSPAFTPTGGDGRIDELIVRVTDGEPAFEIVEGTPAGSPSPPAITGDNYVWLATVTIPPTTSVIDNSMIEDRRGALAATPLKGTLGYAEVTAGQTGISSITDLTGLSVTVDVPAGRRIKITGYCLVQQKTSAGLVGLTIYESTTQLQANNLGLSSSGATSFGTSIVSASVTPSEGSHTYKLRLSTTAGTVDLLAGVTFPAYILVEDRGPA